MNGDYLNFNNKMMTVKVEHDACCSNDNNNDINVINNNEVDEIKSKFKFKNNVKCKNKCFNLVDKWINKAIVRVPTGDNWHNIIQREIALLKVRYPFLTEKQLKGKALVKFGIPCFMGNIVRTGDKKVTGALAKELLRTQVKKSRVPAAFKVSHKILPCVKKLDVSHNQVSTIENYLESNSHDIKDLKTENKMFQQLKSVDDNLKLRNPYHSNEKENDCPNTPRKKRIHASIHVPLKICYDSDGPQTPTKKFKLEPTKREDRRLLKFVTQAADEVMVDSDIESDKSLMKPDCSPSPLTKDLWQRIKNNPLVYIWDRDADKSDLDDAPLSQADDNLNAKKNDGNKEILTVDLESASLTESLNSSEYNWPAGQRLRESLSLEKLDSTHKSFEKLSLEDDSDLITISPIRKNTQDYLRTNLNNNVVSPLTQDTLSIKLSASLDHDYAKDDATQLVSSSSLNSLFPFDSRIFSIRSDDVGSDNERQLPLDLSGSLKNMDNIFTPPSLPTQDINSISSQLLQDSFMKNNFNENEFSEDEFSEYPADSSKQFTLSDLCDEFSEGWKKVPYNRSVPPSTDIRQEMNRISIEEIKQNVTQIIDYLYSDND